MAVTVSATTGAANGADYTVIPGRSFIFNGQMPSPHTIATLTLKGIAGGSGSGDFSYPLNISTVVNINKAFNNCMIAQQNNNAITLKYIDMN
jgi:hypothetical protein